MRSVTHWQFDEGCILHVVLLQWLWLPSCVC